MARENFLGVFGHVAIDTIASVRKFPEVNSCGAVTEKKTVFGGTGANLALAASRLGVMTSLASFVGDDLPPDFERLLMENKVDLTDLVKIENAYTPSIFLVSDESQNQVGFVDQGVMKDQDNMPLLKHTIDSSQVVHIGTGRPGYAFKVAERAKEKRKKVAFDPAQELSYVYSPEDFAKVIRKADFFFCNEKELEYSLKYLSLHRPEELLDIVGIVVTTRGRHGSRILSIDEGAIEIEPVAPERVIETTGAGDSYRAGFYAGLSRGLSLEECGKIASVAASFAVEGLGGQARLPTWDEVYKRASTRSY